MSIQGGLPLSRTCFVLPSPGKTREAAPWLQGGVCVVAMEGAWGAWNSPQDTVRSQLPSPPTRSDSDHFQALELSAEMEPGRFRGRKTSCQEYRAGGEVEEGCGRTTRMLTAPPVPPPAPPPGDRTPPVRFYSRPGLRGPSLHELNHPERKSDPASWRSPTSP